MISYLEITLWAIMLYFTDESKEQKFNSNENLTNISKHMVFHQSLYQYEYSNELKLMGANPTIHWK